MKTGYLEVIAGPMYSGKTEELIRLVKRAVLGKKRVQVFKHAIDTRYGVENKLYSHSGITVHSVRVKKAVDILKITHTHSHIVAIDEAQWFGPDLIAVTDRLLKSGKHVIIAGLALTFDRQPFVPIPDLMALAERVTKLTAVCTLCGADAMFHKRVTKEVPHVNPLTADPGFVSKLDTSVFQARCRQCFDLP